jgi:succinate dehydrogenase/fumarate reductase flavoprotein subunit
MIEHAGGRVVFAAADDVPWTDTVDVVVAGSGAAGWSAALAARHAGADVLVLEKLDHLGGTTAKAGGEAGGAPPGALPERAGTWFWICNHPWLAELGHTDPRPDALRYLARLARPMSYRPDHPTLGLPADEQALLEAFYDHGARVVTALDALGAPPLRPLAATWDYWADLPENRTPRGRALYMPLPDGREATGAEIVAAMAGAGTDAGVRVRTGCPVHGLVVDEDSGEVLGVQAGASAATASLVRARGGVVFATGGFTHSAELRGAHLPAPITGGLAARGSTGDVVHLAAALGGRLANMNEAWLTPMVLDHGPEPASGAFRLPGDSMVLLDRFGHRVVNEKVTYNEMTRAFLRWDEGRGEYPSRMLVMLFDQSVSERCRAMPGDAPIDEGGGNPLARLGGNDQHELSAATLDELAVAIDARLARHQHRFPGLALDAGWAEQAQASVRRFDEHARAGVDEDFHRGETRTQRARSGDPRSGEFPNPTMHPFDHSGPWHAVLLVAGTLDTKGGPMIDPHARIVRPDGSPIGGLYGAGNCIASPAGQAYWGGGTTLGLAVTFGWLAGEHAAARAG